MYRAFLEITSDGNLLLPADEAHHLVRVRRAKPGSRFFGFHPDGHWYLCELVRTGQGWGCELLERERESRESGLRIDLGQALLKKDKFEWVIQKAVELGTWGIFPLTTRRSEVRLSGSREAKKVIRWNRILREAVKQCGRTRVPTLSESMELAAFLERDDCEIRLVLDEAGGLPLKALLKSPARSCSILVGPEGGWAEEERDLFRRSGLQPVSLGSRILRAETAPVVALSLLQYELGDLSNRGPDDSAVRQSHT